MANVAFKFPRGVSVSVGALSVASWGNYVPPVPAGDVWDQAADGGVTVTINAIRSPHQVAPEPVLFETTVTGFDTNTLADKDVYDVALHDKMYFWDFGEEYFYEAPLGVLALDAHDGGQRANARFATGANAGHVFRSSAAFTVRLAVYEPSSGKWGQATVAIQTADADTYYSGTASLYVNTTGSYTNGPLGADNHDNFNDAWNILKQADTPTRIVVEGGQTHVITGQMQFRPNGSNRSTTFRVETREGSSERCKFNVVTTAGEVFVDFSEKDAGALLTSVCLKDLHIKGTWNVTTESGQWNNRLVVFSGSHAQSMLIDGCKLGEANRGATSYDFGLTQGKTSRRMFVQDTIFYDWADYGWFGGTSKMIWQGNYMRQNPDAAVGGDKDGTQNNHGPWRSAAPGDTIFQANDMASGTGWSVGVGVARTVQPAFRWMTGSTLSGTKLNFFDNLLQGGAIGLNAAAHSEDRYSNIQNLHIRQNVIIGGFQSHTLINLSHTGGAVEHNTLIHSDNTKNSAPNAFIQMGKSAGYHGSGGSNATNDAGELIIRNNDCINMYDNDIDIWNEHSLVVDQFTNVTVEDNNLHYEDGDTAFNPIALPTVIVPQFRGYWTEVEYSYASPKSGSATPANTPTFIEPDTGSSALDGNGDRVRGATMPQSYSV